jgi:hypothetical protein
MSQSGRPLLRNVYNKNAYLNDDGVKTSSVSPETNILTIAVSETVKLKDSTRCLLDRPADGYNRQIQTVALWVVAGEEKGSLESETVKYGHESHGTRTREWMRWRGTAVIVNDRPSSR